MTTKRLVVGTVLLIAVIGRLAHDMLSTRAFVAQRELQEIAKGPDTIMAHPNSTLGDDVLSIVHFSDNSTIEVTLAHSARCTHPSLVGRLSGPALLSVDWHSPRNTTKGIVHEGSYSSPLSGKFFLEIIVIHCDARVFQGNASVGKICMEDPQHHRITANESTISVLKDNTRNGLGHWIFNSSTFSSIQPLYTRVQGKAEYRNLSGYQAYDFAWKDEIVIPRQPKTSKVCFLGDSHSRESMDAFKRLNLTTNNISVAHLWVGKLNEILADDRVSERTKRQLTTCNVIIMAIGQWDVSHKAKKGPLSFAQYESNLEDVLDLLQKRVPYVPVLGRNIHFNGLGMYHTRCTPWDWRSPTVLRQLTTIVQRVFARRSNDQFTYLDTSFVVEPMWDGAGDWSHLEKPVVAAETLFLVSEALKLPLPTTNSSLQIE